MCKLYASNESGIQLTELPRADVSWSEWSERNLAHRFGLSVYVERPRVMEVKSCSMNLQHQRIRYHLLSTIHVSWLEQTVLEFSRPLSAVMMESQSRERSYSA